MWLIVYCGKVKAAIFWRKDLDMICSKCNSQIPDGAKFCTVCGAPCGTAADVKPLEASAAPEKRYFCSKCGLELQYGAKFCTACGTPANIGDITPLANDGKTFGNGNMAAVSLEKEPNPNDLVAAMPTPAPVPAAASEPVPVTVPASAAVIPEQAPAATPTPAAFATPTPVAAPAPAPVSAPVSVIPEQAPSPAPAIPTPTPAAAPVPNYNGGAYTPNPVVPEMPAFAPSGSANGASPAYGDINGLNGAAAASVAVPGKKKVSGGKIALIIVIVLVVLAGAAAAFFFTNKATALSIVMGKPKYAAMVEKDSLKESVENINMENLSQQVKTVSSVVPMLADSRFSSSSFMSDKTSGGAQFAKLMNASSMGSIDEIDIESMIKGYGDYMQSTFGASRISGSMTMNLELGDEFSDDDIEQVLKYINGSEITYDIAANGDIFGGEFGLTFNGKPLNAKVIADKDGTMYLSFPFVSDKALKIKIPTNELTRSAASPVGTAVLDLDPNELERLFGELIDVYSEYIKDSSVSMEKGSLTIAGSVIEGKQITADINGTNLANLINALCEKLANDQYFCTQITNYIKNFDPSFTESQYKSALTELAPDTLNGSLVIDTIIKNNGDVLAKSYKLASNGTVTMEIAFADNDNESDVEIKVQGQTLLTVKAVKTNDTDGEMTISVGMGNGKSLGIVMSYYNIGTATFGKSKISTGSYNIRFDLSNADEHTLGSETVDILRNLSMNFSTSVEDGTEKVSMTLDAGSIMKFDIGMNMKLSDDVSAYSIPSDVIDISAAMTNGDVDEDTYNQLMEYAQELSNSLNDVFAGTDLEDILGDIIGGGSGSGSMIPGNTVDPNELDDLEDKIFDEMMEVYSWLTDNDVYSGDAYENAIEYQNSLRDLDSRVINTDNCTKEQLEAFQAEFNKIIKQKSALKKAVEAAGKNNTSGGTSTPNISGSTSTPNTSGGTSTPNTSGGTSTPNTSGSTSTPNTSGSTSAPNTSGSMPSPNTSGNTSVPGNSGAASNTSNSAATSARAA